MEWVFRYWVEAAFGVISVLFGWGYRALSSKLKAARKEQDAVKAGMCAILRDRIVQAYNHYTERGEWPIYARDSVLE